MGPQHCSYYKPVSCQSPKQKLQNKYAGWPGDHSTDNVKFRDNSLTVCSTPAHVKCYSYHACTSLIVSDGVGMQQCMIQTKIKSTNSAMSDYFKHKQINMQLTTNSFRPLFPDKIFSQTFSKIWHFTDSCQNPWHFQVFQTSGHPEYVSCIKVKWPQ